jgi:uncharacterized protein
MHLDMKMWFYLFGQEKLFKHKVHHTCPGGRCQGGHEGKTSIKRTAFFPLCTWCPLCLENFPLITGESKKFFLLLVFALILFTSAGCSAVEQFFLFLPTNLPHANDLTPWTNEDGEVIGYAREVESPVNVWLMLHGNGGQAAQRAYAIPCFSDQDSVYILEYPGYGKRAGVPSRETFDQAAQDAYLLLRERYQQKPVCVAAESIGSGPASTLASQAVSPDKIVLIVPFDRLSLVAKRHFPAFLVDLILQSDWNNVESLSNYAGQVDIFGAQDDTVIPVEHAKALAEALPGANLIIVQGGHNDWSVNCRVEIRR